MPCGHDALGSNCERGKETTDVFGKIQIYRLLESPEQIQSRISKALEFVMKDYVFDLIFNRDSEAYDNLFAHRLQKPLNQSEIIEKLRDRRYTLAQFWEDLGVISTNTPERKRIDESANKLFLWINRFIPGSSGDCYFISWKVAEIRKILYYMLDGPGQMSMKTLQGILMETFKPPVMREDKYAQRPLCCKVCCSVCCSGVVVRILFCSACCSVSVAVCLLQCVAVQRLFCSVHCSVHCSGVAVRFCLQCVLQGVLQCVLHWCCSENIFLQGVLLEGALQCVCCAACPRLLQTRTL